MKSKLVSLLVLAAVLAACGGGSAPGSRSTGPEGSSTYFFRLHGMPCFWIEYARDDGANYAKGYAGLTCDWSKWDGRTGIE